MWISMFKKLVSCITLLTFLLANAGNGFSQAALSLPEPGAMLSLSPTYFPVMIKGLRVHPEDPLLFDFMLDAGDSGLNVHSLEFKSESQKLIKYFLAALTIKEDDLWVNLSPYEKGRVIPQELGTTEMGRDMLAQDYILKQLTASLIYPERELGKKFWDNVYTKARQMYGVTDIPVNTFNKVWIVADKAKVLEHNNSVYVVASHLKVMLAEDYLSLNRHSGEMPRSTDKAHAVASEVIRQIILPALDKEVNQGKNFAPLRQIFYSMILASWYKFALKDAFLNQVYSNKSKIGGILSDDPAVKEKIYQRYLKAYKKGVFNYIKEDVDGPSQKTIPRKYFSGGEDFAMLKNGPEITNYLSLADASAISGERGEHSFAIVEEYTNEVRTKANPLSVDHAQLSSNVATTIFEELVKKNAVSIPDKVYRLADPPVLTSLIDEKRRSQYLYGLRQALFIFTQHYRINLDAVTKITVNDRDHWSRAYGDDTRAELDDRGSLNFSISLPDREYPYLTTTPEGQEANVFLQALLYSFGKIPEPEHFTQEQFKSTQGPYNLLDTFRKSNYAVPSVGTPIEKLNALLYDPKFGNDLLQQWTHGKVSGLGRSSSESKLSELTDTYRRLLKNGHLENERPLSYKEIRLLLSVYFSAPDLPSNLNGFGTAFGISNAQKMDWAKATAVEWGLDGGPMKGNFSNRILTLEEKENRSAGLKSVLRALLPADGTQPSLMNISKALEEYLLDQQGNPRFDDEQTAYAEIRDAVMSELAGDEDLQKQSFRKALRATHPDLNKNNPLATPVFSLIKEISTATERSSNMAILLKSLRPRLQDAAMMTEDRNIKINSFSDINRLFKNAAISREEPYVLSNETGLSQALTSLPQAKSNAGTVFVGFSGLANFEIMTQRKPAYAIISDINGAQIEALRLALETLNDPELVLTASDTYWQDKFIEKLMIKINKMQEFKEASLELHPDLEGEAWRLSEILQDIKHYLKTASWVINRNSAEYLRRMYNNGKIALVNLDIKDTASFKAIAHWVQTNGLRIDTVYMSNIPEAIMNRAQALPVRERDGLRTKIDTTLSSLANDGDEKTSYLEAVTKPKVGLVVEKKDLADYLLKDDAALRKAPGGIALNAQNMILDIAREGNGIKMNLNPALLARFKAGDFSGVVPVILRITPVQNPLTTLGFESNNPS